MLDDFDATVRNLLMQNGNFGTEIEVSFELPSREWAGRLSRPAVNCWCFDVRENLKLRSSERQVQKNGNSSQITRPPKRIDLIYLITAWARKVEDEHRLFWRALSVLKPITQLQPAQCVGALRYQTLDIPLTVADMSVCPVNLVDLWGVMDNQMHLGFTLQATLELDTLFVQEVPLVLEATILTGQAREPSTQRLDEASGNIKIKSKASKQEGQGE
ncbi:MAG: DUF4255 domain-containing protein [Chloroflexota bacterium]|nr:DUF4255 domain-containing protein [Chloroflexota bacterium]